MLFLRPVELDLMGTVGGAVPLGVLCWRCQRRPSSYSGATSAGTSYTVLGGYQNTRKAHIDRQAPRGILVLVKLN